MKHFLSNTIAFLVIVFLLAGCTSPSMVQSSGAVNRSYYNDPEVITTSLFDAKDKTLSEESIQRLLNGRIVLPDTIRIAVYKYGGVSVKRYYDSWLDEEFLKVQQQYIDTLIHQINSSARVKKVILMPSMMISSNPSLTELREATVRLQADVLLVFSVTSDIYYKYRMFKEDEAKAFATTQAILMDIRTGVIPHSSIVTRENFIRKAESDLTTSEMRKRAEVGAIISSLTETGARTATFLNQKK